MEKEKPKKKLKKDMINSKSHGFEMILKYHKELTEGEVLCIDPSSGSKGSMPGYALFKAGQLVDNGTIEVPLGDKVYDRMAYIAKCLKAEFNTTPDVLVIEDIPVGRGRLRLKALRSLNMSVGAIVGALAVEKIIPLHPRFWKAHASTKYSKGDAEDAKEMGLVCFKVVAERFPKEE